MKRIFAGILLVCLLLTVVPYAAAEPAQEQTQQTEEQVEETAAEEEQAEEAATEETSDATKQNAEKTVPADVLEALQGETAIHAMEVRVTVSKDGVAKVIQQIDMGFIGVVDKIRFSVPENASDARVEGYDADSDEKAGLQYLTVSTKHGFTGNQSFRVVYTLTGMITAAEGSQKFEFPLLTMQDYRVGLLTYGVEFPEPVTTRPRYHSTYYTNIAEQFMTVRTEGNWVVGMMNQIMRDNDSLTMTLTVPNGFFSGDFTESSLPTVLTVITLILLALALLYWFRFLRNAPMKIRTRTLPPDGVNPGDLPFLIAGGDTDFNMLVSHWAVLGYLSIFVTKSGHVLLRRRMDMGNERRVPEQKLFALLFADGNVCDGASIRYKRVGEKAMQVVRSYWSKRLYERGSGSPLVAKALCWLSCALAAMAAMDGIAPGGGYGFFMFLALVAGAAMGMMIGSAWGEYYLSHWLQAGVGGGCVVLMLIIGLAGGGMSAVFPAVLVTLLLGRQTCHGGLRRPYGDEVIEQTMGFRKFVLHASEHHVLQMQVRDPQYFYKLLPYAEAMGQGKRFTALFHDCKLEHCQWYEAERGVPGSAAVFYDHYKATLDMLNLSIKK